MLVVPAFNKVSVPRWLICLKSRHLFRWVFCCSTCLLEQMVHYNTVQTTEENAESFTNGSSWNTWKVWTLSTQRLSIFHAFYQYSHKYKVYFFLKSPEELIRLLSDCIVNLLHGILQELKKTSGKISKQIHTLPVVGTTWKEKRRILQTRKDSC